MLSVLDDDYIDTQTPLRRAWLIRGMYTRWRLSICTSLRGSKTSSFSMYMKRPLKVVTSQNIGETSRHRGSIRWLLWMELPVMMLPLLSALT